MGPAFEAGEAEAALDPRVVIPGNSEKLHFSNIIYVVYPQINPGCRVCVGRIFLNSVVFYKCQRASPLQTTLKTMCAAQRKTGWRLASWRSLFEVVLASFAV